MKFEFLPSTAQRVAQYTNPSVNHRIQENTYANIRAYRKVSTEDIQNRMRELEKEWDIERVLEANAASAVVLSTALGFTVHKKWFLLSGVVGAFLLQHAVQGWCPPVPLFRRLGVRTLQEIDEEKTALQHI